MAFLFWSIVGLFGGSAVIIIGGWVAASRSPWFRKELVGRTPGESEFDGLGDGN